MMTYINIIYKQNQKIENSYIQSNKQMLESSKETFWKQVKKPKQQISQKTHPSFTIQSIIKTLRKIFQNFPINWQQLIDIITKIPLHFVKRLSILSKSLLLIHKYIETKSKQCLQSPIKNKYYAYLHLIVQQYKYENFVMNKLFISAIKVSNVNIYDLKDLSQQILIKQTNNELSVREDIKGKETNWHHVDSSIKQVARFQKVHECLGCITKLQQGKRIPNDQNQYYTTIKYNENIETIKNKTCAILNTGGGYIFVIGGFDPNIVKGQPLSQGQFIQYKQWYIQIMKNFIYPNNYYLCMDIVKVWKQKDSHVIRITLKALRDYSMYMVKTQIKNYLPTYTFYFFDPLRAGSCEDICTVSSPEDIYKIATYKIKNRIIEPLEKIVQKQTCIKACKSYRNLLSGSIKSLQIQFLSILDKQPPIKWRYQTIIIFQDAEYDRDIEKMKRCLELKKLDKYVEVKPYQSIRNNSKKSMWFFSHDFEMKKLNQALDETGLGNEGKKKYTIISVTKFIQIKSQKSQKQVFKYEQYSEILRNKFKQSPTVYKIPQNNIYEKQEYNYLIKLNSYQESVYSFLWLDNIRVRCQYMKQKQFKELTQKFQNFIMQQ